MLNHPDWYAFAVGLVGTLLWAHNGRLAKYAACWWAAGAALWIYYAWINGLTAMLARDMVSLVLYSYGIYRWLRPRRHTRQTDLLVRKETT